MALLTLTNDAAVEASLQRELAAGARRRAPAPVIYLPAAPVLLPDVMSDPLFLPVAAGALV